MLFRSKEGIKHPMIVKAEDPITSLFGAFGKYIYDNGISLNDIDKVMLTGVGSAYINHPLYGLSTAHTDEFLANGLGAVSYTHLLILPKFRSYQITSPMIFLS